MKKIISLILAVLAINFLFVAGGAGYLIGTGALNKEKVAKIQEVMFPAPTSQPTTQPTTQPTSTTATPLLQLEELLAKQAGRPATEQIEYIRNAFDEQMAQLDRRMREMEDLQRQIEAARYQVARDRALVDARQKAIDAKAAEAAKADEDTGFQNGLQLYNSMAPAQVKKVFLGMDDALVARYLQAMTPRTATKILKEFKAPEEMARVQTIMDKIRRAPGGDSGNLGSAVSGGSAGAPDPGNPAVNGAERAAGRPTQPKP